MSGFGDGVGSSVGCGYGAGRGGGVGKGMGYGFGADPKGVTKASPKKMKSLGYEFCFKVGRED
jgi:hypothetical protein